MELTDKGRRSDMQNEVSPTSWGVGIASYILPRTKEDSEGEKKNSAPFIGNSSLNLILSIKEFIQTQGLKYSPTSLRVSSAQHTREGKRNEAEDGSGSGRRRKGGKQICDARPRSTTRSPSRFLR